MRDAENIAEVARLAPDYMGFIFYERSPRFAGGMEPAWLDVLPAEIVRVGVFVDASEEDIRACTERFSLDAVQLHGDESPELCERLHKDYMVIKTFGVSDEKDFRRAADYEGACDYFLFDTKTPLKGGSGKRFDHSVLEAYKGGTPYFLSGGIDPCDAGGFSVATRASGGMAAQAGGGRLHCLDINSRFELEPGVKDVELLQGFIEAVRHGRNSDNIKL